MTECKFLRVMIHANYEGYQTLSADKGFTFQELPEFAEKVNPYLSSGWTIANISVKSGLFHKSKARGVPYVNEVLEHVHVLLTR